MSAAFGVLFVVAAMAAVWFLVVAIFSKAKRKKSFRNFGIAMALVIAAPIGGVYFMGHDDIAGGWQSSADRRLAAEADIDDPEVWYAERNAHAEAQTQASAVAAVADAEAAEAERIEAEEEAARVAAEEEAEAQLIAEAEAAEAEALAVAEAEEAEACRRDLSCYAEEHFTAAEVRCPREVERLARYDFEWTDGFLDFKFTHFRWKDIDAGVVTYIGDKIRFQNGFGAMQGHLYECDYDPAMEMVLEVRAQPGRL